MSAIADSRQARAGTTASQSGTPGSRAPECWAPGCRAQACGARTRAGGSCLGLAMANGRCRLHGGASTGPRTQAGLARMVAAKTKHGRYAMTGMPKRQAQRWARALIVRIRLTAAATLLRPYLPAGMAARLDAAPEALRAPKHPSQVAFEALCAATQFDNMPAALGLGRRARAAQARLGAGGAVADDARALALHGRESERLAARAEAASQAPWRVAIAAARGLKRAVREARRQVRVSRNDPTCGAATGAGGQTWDSRNDPVRGAAMGAGDQTPESRNDPIRGAAVRAQATGKPLEVRVGVPAGHQAGDTTGWAPGSPGLGEALAREVMKRRLQAELALRGNDPIRGEVADAAAAGGERVALAGSWVGSARSLAIGSTALGGRTLGGKTVGGKTVGGTTLGRTTLARIWEPSVAEVLAARFGPPAVEGWWGPPVAPPGIAAVPSGGCAQRPYMRPAGSRPAGSGVNGGAKRRGG